ncbi:DUF2066 domain-containing protein [Gammaproteobacteria bacterium]|jgi:hypothetical protein|nr:DUF2066 domain-containing protein [Gammaproteobacteria bacterium]MDA9800077.1 DUF2066 domain-containing protein [Gammaproteobacteria bacterium]MDC0919219.1 DUF2066 domain-containing protein [Gammaproteobacteria bacterium]
MNQKIKILLLLNFLLVNMAFSKELPALFEVKIPVDQYTNTNDGLNKAFNRLIHKLSGSRSKKFLWRIGDAQLNKIEFVSSYSTEFIGEEEFLSVKFNSEALIPELRKIGTPLIGFNRPVILILFKIDTGESAPIYLSSVTSSDQLASEIKQTFKNIALERGVYLELPEFDLEDQNLLNQANLLFSPSNYIQEKFYNDAFLNIELVRIGINQWSINGDLKTISPLQEKQVIEFFENAIHEFLDEFLEVKPLEPGASGERVMVTIQGLNNYQDFQSVESELDKIFAIKSRSFHAFQRTKIDYTTQLFLTKDSLIKELRGSTKFLIKEYNEDTQHLKLEYLN